MTTTTFPIKHTTKSVRISELKVGDLVLAHGGVWKLAELRYDLPDSNYQTLRYIDRGNIRNFRAELIGDCFDVLGFGGCCLVPKHWIKDYSIQSNDLAVWTKVVVA